MSVFSRIKGFFVSEKRSMESVPNYGRFPWFGFVAKSGVAVNRETALGLSAVYRAINVLSGSIASLPINVYNIENNKITLLVDHSVNRLLNRKPSALYTPYVFKQTMMVHLLTDGNCFILKRYDAKRQVKSLKILDYREVEVMFDDDLDIKAFIYKSKTYTQDDIIHICGMGFDGLMGKSPISVARENIGLSIASQQYGEEVFQNGIFSSGVLEYEKKLGDTEYERLKDTFAGAYQGLRNSGKPILLESGAKYKPINLKIEDKMFIESRQITVNEVARIFGVPPHILYELSKSSFNNIESLGIEFVKYSLTPWVENIESAFNCDLIRDDEFGRLEIRFDLDAMLRGDSKARSEYYKNMFNTAAFSPNDILKKEGFNPYEGGENRYIPLNMLPVEMIEQYYSNAEKTTE